MNRASALFLVSLCLASVASAQTGSTLIRIEGATSVEPCARRLTEWYHNNHSAIDFTVNGTSINRGIAALTDGRAEVALSSRQALGGEVSALRDRHGKKFVQIPMAVEVAAILVHPSNPVHELSIFDLRQILSGNAKNWKQVGGNDAPITIYGRDDSSDSREFIEEEFMGDEGIAGSAVTFPKSAALYAAVAHDKNSIGFATVDLNLSSAIRFIGIKASSSGPAVMPTTENIKEHRYPLTRPLYLIFAGEPSGELERFAEWVLSAQGQLVVEAVEFWPLGAPDREKGKTLLAAR
jgi:phosphate transport system substrate-binding protein